MLLMNKSCVYVRFLTFGQKPKVVEPLTVEDVNEIQKDFMGSAKKTRKLFTKLRRKGMPIFENYQSNTNSLPRK